MRSTGHAWSYKAWCSAVVGCLFVFFNSSNWCISILAEKLHFDPCQVITKVEAPIRQLNTEQAHTVRRAEGCLPAAFHPLHPGDRERQQTDLLRHHSFKRTWRPPHYPRIQEAHTHQSTLSVWFTPPSISKAQYCQVPLQAHQTSRNKTFRHLRGEKTSLICSDF